MRKIAFTLVQEVRNGNTAVCHQYNAANTAGVMTGSFRVSEWCPLRGPSCPQLPSEGSTGSCPLVGGREAESLFLDLF